MRPGIVGHRVFGAPVDVDAPPTPFALGQKLMGPTLICVGVSWVKQTPGVCPTCGIAPFSEASDKSGNPMAAVNAPLPRRRRDFSSQGDAIRRPQPLMECCPSQEDSSCLPQHL